MTEPNREIKVFLLLAEMAHGVSVMFGLEAMCATDDCDNCSYSEPNLPTASEVLHTELPTG